eukprot:11519994-Heterocapsa_arctica.AAC.1
MGALLPRPIGQEHEAASLPRSFSPNANDRPSSYAARLPRQPRHRDHAGKVAEIRQWKGAPT